MTKEEFIKKVDKLGETNWKIKKILEDCGGYDNAPQNIKDLLHKQVGVNPEIIFNY